MTLVDVLRERAADGAERGYRFVSDGKVPPMSLSYMELDRRARDVAAELSLLAPQGARAILLYPPGLEFVVAFFGALYAGVAPVPVYPPSGADLRHALSRLEHVIADARPEALLTTGALLAANESAGLVDTPAGARWMATDRVCPGSGDGWKPPRVLDGDVAFVQYTSGSTAMPKGVVVRHRHLMANLEAIRAAMKLSADTTAVGWVPSYHDMGLVGFILEALYAGFSSYLMAPQDFLRRPALWLETISRFGGVVSGGPNFGFDLCTRRVDDADRDRLDLSSWRVAFSGAEKIRPDVLRRFARRFSSVGFDANAMFPCYGLAEASLFVSGAQYGNGVGTAWISRSALENDRAEPAEPDASGAVEIASCGRVADGHRVVIVEPTTGRPLGPDRVGEVWFAGPSVTSGYWRRRDESDDVFGAVLANGGEPFLRTGDLGFLRDGDLYLTGRRKDLMVVRGRNIYPADVEEAAQAVDSRLRPGCGASFLADGDSSNLVLVQETSEQDDAELAELASAVRRAVFERLEVGVDDVVFIRPRSVAKTSSGKLRRHACRADYRAGALDVVFPLRGTGSRVEPAEA
ncbi:fatty acyl-AMP ligase [Actinocrispum wychmicini]|uniref:Acyl-CoA synthetase (AMP-forming)/AMP-acid ligase II n=1 Tax=Actinocrispum wychmicini TaxID=1213861 RepID=A0A4V2S823_9PSEU|nr:fatty acyl-AMP ligase [Actinocrispum wychmicini]TCO61900.1 acyl-CoA synthetase (AMP-forming)/AMP-acid ligase II [Actinocrispum wychmicini]